jgi:hypothetical protein
MKQYTYTLTNTGEHLAIKDYDTLKQTRRNT